MKKKHIIWDFDGTIADTYPNITKALLEVCRDGFGAPVEYDDVYALCKISLPVCFEELAVRCETSADQIRDRFNSQYQERTIGVDEPIFPGVLEVMRMIKASGGMNLLVTHRGRDSLERYGAMGGCRELIVDSLAGGEGFADKPDPAAFLHLISKYDLPKDETLGVGDRSLDVGAAMNSGISSCYFDPEGLGLVVADLNIKDYSELAEWLREG